MAPMTRSWGLLLGAALGACILQPTDAEACGAAYPAGSFVQLSRERTLIVWDAKTKTEHFVRKPTFDGDPKAFGFFVPTPTVPVIKKEDDAIFDRVNELLEPKRPNDEGARGVPGTAAAGGGGHVDVLQTVVIDGFQVVTLRATDENALGEWLGKNQFVDKPALRAWAKRYTDKSWLITAMRYEGLADKGPARNALETPTLRLSFTVDAPFYPYTEVAADLADQQAFLKRYGGNACPSDDPLCFDEPTYTPPRPLDVWVVAQTSVQSLMGQAGGGPPVMDAALVTGADVAKALGDTKEWGFDPKGEKTWVVSHLAENVAVRNATDDLTFGPYDLPKPRLGGSLAPPPPPSLLTPWSPPEPPSLSHGLSRRAKLRRVGGALLALLVLAAAGLGWWTQRERREGPNA